MVLPESQLVHGLVAGCNNEITALLKLIGQLNLVLDAEKRTPRQSAPEADPKRAEQLPDIARALERMDAQLLLAGNELMPRGPLTKGLLDVANELISGVRGELIELAARYNL